MKTIRLREIIKDRTLQQEILEGILSGFVIIYPTDTVYGLGCNAEDAGAVARLRKMKGAEHRFSVIAPSKNWIREKCIISLAANACLGKLPGRYTLILAKKDPTYLSAASPGPSVGVRIPKHPLTRLMQRAGMPFVTTSANISGSEVMQTVGRLPFSSGIDITIDGGKLGKKASTIIDCTKDVPARIER